MVPGSSDDVIVKRAVTLDVAPTVASLSIIDNASTPGSITVADGATLQRFNGPNTVLNYSNATFTNDGVLTGFSLNFNGSSAQTLAGNGTNGGLVINNANNVNITGSQAVGETNITFNTGKIILQNNDLTLTTDQILSANSSGYVVTLGTGRLVMPISTSKLFPVGPSTTSYNPVTISPNGLSTFSVWVKVGIDNPTGDTGYVNRQWQIDRDGVATAALTEFRGVEAGPANHFIWQTASESNSKAHYLQRSTDGQNDWMTLVGRAAAGDSNQPNFYEADDNAPLAAAYYRVLFEDTDGKADVSPILFLKRKNDAGGQFSFFPNPIGAEGFWLNVPPVAIGQPLTVRFYDAIGRFVFEKKP